jgi:hypothetical protein
VDTLSPDLEGFQRKERNGNKQMKRQNGPLRPFFLLASLRLVLWVPALPA